jgi:hypothetical protein
MGAMRRAIRWAIGLVMLAAPAAAQEWGPPAAEYVASLTFTEERGKSITHRLIYTAKRQRLDYKAGKDDEATIVDEARQAVFVLRPAQKLFRQSPYVRPAYDFGIANDDTKRERLGEEAVDGIATVKYRVESKSGMGESYSGLAWLSAERIVVKLEGILTQGKYRPRKIAMTMRDLKIGPVDAALFDIPADYKKVEEKRK